MRVSINNLILSTFPVSVLLLLLCSTMVFAEDILFSTTHKGWIVKNTGSNDIICHVPTPDATTTKKSQVTVIINNSDRQQISPGDEFTVPAGARATIVVNSDDIGAWENTGFIAEEGIVEDFPLNFSVAPAPLRTPRLHNNTEDDAFF